MDAIHAAHPGAWLGGGPNHALGLSLRSRPERAIAGIVIR
jgi:hypothetical protein